MTCKSAVDGKIMRFSSLLGKHVETLLQYSLEIFTEAQKKKMRQAHTEQNTYSNPLYK